MLNDTSYIDSEFIKYVEYDSNQNLHDDVIYEINDNISEEQIVISPSISRNLSDNVSERTCSSIENELEAILFDYTIIIDCLTSISFQRSKSEIAILSQLLQSIPEFMYINANELEYVCQAVKLCTVDCANQIIVRKCSVLNDWFLCLQGCLRREGFITNFLYPGSYIGTDLWGKETLISDYDLYSNCDNCKLLVIGTADLEPMNQLNSLMIKTSDEDKSVIAVYEAYKNMSAKTDMCSYVLTKATTEVLISHLFSNPKWVSSDFIEDFFLTRKLFLNSTRHIRNEIIESIYSDNHFSKENFDVLIRWMSQSFSDFEHSPKKLLFIDEISRLLKKQNNNNLLYTLFECCSNCAVVREIQTDVSFRDFVVPVKLSTDNTLFYFHQVNSTNEQFRNGDLILELDGKQSKFITVELIKSLNEDNQRVSLTIKYDLLGYHEHLLHDIASDAVSIKSTPSNSRYSTYSSGQMTDITSLSVNDSDTNTGATLDRNSYNPKRPVILPNFFSTLHSGSIGKFFKNPKHYAKSAIGSGSRSVSDVTSRLENLQNGNRDLAGSNLSISRFSHRLKSKRQRRSIGSNSDLIQSFSDLDIGENNVCVDRRSPIRIHIRDVLIGHSYSPNTKSDIRHFHFMIEPSTTVTEVIVRTLLKLNFTSAKSTDFYLVEIKVNEDSGMIHEKILRPDTSNLIDRLKEHMRFYLKHCSIFGESIIPQSESDKMVAEFKSPSVTELSSSNLVIRLFIRSHKLLCRIRPEQLISHVTGHKATLKYHRQRKKTDHIILDYMHLSDFYKYWVVTEICREGGTSLTRAATIQYFISLALKAMYIGHIDLFFSIVSGLESIEVQRLNLSWDKVPKRDRKLLQNLKTTLDVSGNMRNLRIVHQKVTSPLIPVTAMVVKDLTMLEETHPTYVTGTINELPVNPNLVNFDKMQKMSKLARNFVNSCCSCASDRSRPVRKHLRTCKMKLDNIENLERLLQQRLDSQTDIHSPKSYSYSISNRRNRKYSFSSISNQSSSTESLSESVASPKPNEEKTSCQIFEQRMMNMKVERYLKTLDSRVIVDEPTLYEMSFACEENSEGSYDTKTRASGKHSKIKENHSSSVRSSNGYNVDISDRAAEPSRIIGNFTEHNDLTNFNTVP